METQLEFIKRKGVLRVADNDFLSGVKELCALVGASYIPYTGAQALPDRKNLELWWPDPQNEKWNNCFEQQDDVILESHTDPAENDKHLEKTLNGITNRITFCKKDDKCVFLGVYALDVPESEAKHLCVWKRFSKEYIL